MIYNYYFITTSISLLFFYLGYYFFIRKGQDFRQIRQFLNIAIIISLILPFNTYSLSLNSLNETLSNENNGIINMANVILTQNVGEQETSINFLNIAILIYLLVSSFFVGRFIFSLVKIINYLLVSEKQEQEGYTLVFLDKKIVAFSFFKWIFVSKSDKSNQIEQIIEHEKVHANQYHSLDIILSELLVAAMWFNPLSWIFKSALKQVHEFLADEGVLDSGFNRLDYQTILVNQVAEERLIAISSHFSYSLIKKRIVMMSKKKKHGSSKLKMLIILPLVALLFMGVSIRNGQLDASNENTKIEQKSNLDDPESILASKEDILNTGEITLSPEDSDFASAFRVVSFTVSTTIGKYEESLDQKNGPRFTQQQINLIKKAKSGRKVYIENIMARGPGGDIRDLGTIVFKIR